MKWIDIVVYYFITGRTISRWRKILSFSFSFPFYLRETKGLWMIFTLDERLSRFFERDLACLLLRLVDVVVVKDF